MLEPEGEKFKSINNEAQGKKSKTDKQTDTGCFRNNWMPCLVYRAPVSYGRCKAGGALSPCVHLGEGLERREMMETRGLEEGSLG